jgi:hypothetical protein
VACLCCEQYLASCSAINIGRFVSDVDRIEEDLKVIPERIARADIDLIVLVDIRWRNTAYVGLPCAGEELVTPVVGNTN